MSQLLEKSLLEKKDDPNLCFVQDEQGRFIPKEKKPKVQLSIEQWTTAFHVYMSVYLSHHDTELQQLLAYSALIRRAAKDNPGNAWAQYDLEFRSSKGADPSRSWGIIDNQLWLQLFCKSHSTHETTVYSLTDKKGASSQTVHSHTDAQHATATTTQRLHAQRKKTDRSQAPHNAETNTSRTLTHLTAVPPFGSEGSRNCPRVVNSDIHHRTTAQKIDTSEADTSARQAIQEVDTPESLQEVDTPETPTCPLETLAHTPIRVDKLDYYLEQYPAREIANEISQGFKEGFKIMFKGPRVDRAARNHNSAYKQPAIVEQMLFKEVSLGRVAGPFTEKPLPNLTISPIGLVPKSTPGKFRLIVDLSFPPGQSVNDGIPHELTSVSYTPFDAITRMSLSNSLHLPPQVQGKPRFSLSEIRAALPGESVSLQCYTNH
ncbi:hypothetical protein ACOMHN_019371 [Nucella lapillus]